MDLDNKTIAIVGLSAIGVAALLKGIDSAILATVVGAIAGICGYEYGKGKGETKENQG